MRPIAAALLICVLVGCESLTSSDFVREPTLGTIAFYSDPMVIEVPDTVQPNVEFTVRVRTYGGGCISQGETVVVVSNFQAEITPYDLEVTRGPANYGCNSDLRLFQHSAVLRFAVTGEATVLIHGRQKPGGSVMVERRVLVR